MTYNKDRYDSLSAESNKAYETYKQEKSSLSNRLNEYKSKYNSEISNINGQRMELRKELKALYKFLKPLGKMLKRDVSIFDYRNEDIAPSFNNINLDKIKMPEYLEHDGILDATPMRFGHGHIYKHYKNSQMVIEYEKDINKGKLEYDNNIKEIESYIKELETACEIAEIYRNTVVMVKDAVSDIIVPEIKYVIAFLYADAVREQVIECDNSGNVKLHSIVEYKESKYGRHYDFVKNAFDFYEVLEKFFTDTVLTNIVEDRIVTEQERRDFDEGIQAIKQELVKLEDMRKVF